MSHPTLSRMLLGTGNLNKLREIRQLLSPLHIEVVGLCDLETRPDDVEETGSTFIANAALKATAYGLASGLPALADDSGLSVDALDGRPGVYSARFSGDNANQDSNNARLLDELAGVPDPKRSAHFECAIALYLPSGPLWNDLVDRAGGLEDVEEFDEPNSGEKVLVAVGQTAGTILQSQRGTGGFGYDPLFLSSDIGKTFAEATAVEKGQVSHRARALRAILQLL